MQTETTKTNNQSSESMIVQEDIERIERANYDLKCEDTSTLDDNDAVMLFKKPVYELTKRLFDIVASLFSIILLVPLLIGIAILIKIDSQGPIFFAHDRVGINGKMFKMYKFRSMINNAEKMIHSFTPEQKEQFYNEFKLDDDPRVTRIGKIMRTTSIDELPQLYNVLIGDMSLVGPRPITPIEVEQYHNDKNTLLSVKPGITGYWQANGRSSIAPEKRRKMELYYVKNRSVLMDISILFKTIGAVINKDGAQ